MCTREGDGGWGGHSQFDKTLRILATVMICDETLFSVHLCHVAKLACQTVQLRPNQVLPTKSGFNFKSTCAKRI